VILCERRVCPACDQSSVYYRQGTDDWRCRRCEAVTADPPTRPPNPSGTNSSHVQALQATDPETVERTRRCGCLGCHEPAAVVIQHPEHGRRAVCAAHADGQEVLGDV